LTVTSAATGQYIRLISPVWDRSIVLEDATLQLSVWAPAEDFRPWRVEPGESLPPPDRDGRIHVLSLEANNRPTPAHPHLGTRMRVGTDPYGTGLGLGADDGISFGANRDSVDIPGGHYTRRRVTRDVTIPCAASLVGAGPDRIAPAGHVIALDGSASKPGNEAGGLEFHWRIIAAPENAQAEIIPAGGPKALFKAHTPGRYLLRLEATQHAPDAALGLTGADELEIAVVPTADPMGARHDPGRHGRHPGRADPLSAHGRVAAAAGSGPDRADAAEAA
jgi:hypothetical protein